MQQRKSADPTRILAWLPDVRGVAPSPSILTDAGLPCVICDGAADLVRGIVEGAGAVLVTDEVLTSSARELLAAAIAQQSPWSDIPVVLLSHAASGALCGDAFERLGNVTVLDWPVRSTTIVSVLRAALATRRRQVRAPGPPAHTRAARGHCRVLRRRHHEQDD